MDSDSVSNAPVAVWKAGKRRIILDRPIIVGIVNVTPDSFSDGGRAFSADDAIAHGSKLVAEGADVLDVGGESTRPGAIPVDGSEELRRVIPVVEGLHAALPETPLSIDTVKAEVAREAIAAGADIVNDVSGFRLDPEMARVCADAHCGVVLMHSRGTVAEMAKYDLANYGDVVGEVCAELKSTAENAERAGVCRKHIVIDPGFGFSKRTEHSVAILGGLRRIADLGYPVVVGLSRKRFVGELSGIANAPDRDLASAALNVVALVRGAGLFRVHAPSLNRTLLDAAFRASPG